MTGFDETPNLNDVRWHSIGRPTSDFVGKQLVRTGGLALPPMYTEPRSHPRARSCGYACAHFVAVALAKGPQLVLENDAWETKDYRDALPPWPVGMEQPEPDLVYLGYGMLKGTQHCFRVDRHWWVPRSNNVSGLFAVLQVTPRGVELVHRMACEAIRRDLVVDQCLPHALHDEVVLVIGKPMFCQGPETNHNYAVTNIPLDKD